MKSRLFSLLRLFLALTLLVLLFRQIGFEQIGLVAQSVNPDYFALLYCLLLTDAIMRAHNWGLLLRVKGHCLRIWELAYNYLAGGFFGTFIPSSLGTDASRAFLVARRNGISLKDSALAIVVLNLMGLLALCIIGFFSAFLLLKILNDPTMAWVIVPVCLAYLALFPFLIRGWSPSGKRLRLPKFGWVFDKIKEVSTALAAFKNDRATMSSVLGIAFFNQLLGILTVYIVLLALGVHVPFLYVVAYVPVIALTRLMPLSIAGFGAEQGIFVFLLSRAGVGPAEAFLSSLILSSVNFSFVLLGGMLYSMNYFYVFLRKEDRPKTHV